MPLSRDDFAPVGFFAVMYTGVTEVRADRILKWLPGPWSSRFPEPIVLPIPSEAPPEVPRMQWQSDKSHWGLAISHSSLTVSWRITQKDQAASVTFDGFLGSAKALLLSYKKQFKPRVGRLGCICQRFARVSNPGRFLAEHFCKATWLKSPFNRPESFEIHSHKAFDLPGSVKVNSWMRVKTGTLVSDPAPAVVVVIAEQDFNTLPEVEPQRDFKDSEISSFFKAAAAEMDNILDLYFPKGRS